MDTYTLGKIPFRGAATALATPFKNGEIDISAFRALTEWQVNMGIDALLVAGTTGESMTLGKEEKKQLMIAAKSACKDSIPLICGCGNADTKTACDLCRQAISYGADALLVITPYCNKGTAAGILEHYKRIADAAEGKPVILYNVPSRTGVNLTYEQYEKLAEIDNICAVKEAAADLGKMTRLCGQTRLAVYSGNDDMTLPVMALGGDGVISVLSNIAPAAVSALTKAAIDGDLDCARKLAHKYAKLISLLFKETNPAPLKYAMELIGLCSGEVRLPLAEIGDGLKAEIKSELTALSMI